MNQYNFSRTTFYYWKKQLRKAKEEHETDEVARRIRALEKEKAELEIENEILKKQSRLSGKSSCNRRPFP